MGKGKESDKKQMIAYLANVRIERGYLRMNRKEILNKAIECVTGQRTQDYGEPENNFQIVADFWNYYAKVRFGMNGQIKAQDVSNMMILLKMARAINGDCVDNYIDIAGYAACAGEIISADSVSCNYVADYAVCQIKRLGTGNDYQTITPLYYYNDYREGVEYCNAHDWKKNGLKIDVFKIPKYSGDKYDVCILETGNNLCSVWGTNNIDTAKRVIRYSADETYYDDLRIYVHNSEENT